MLLKCTVEAMIAGKKHKGKGHQQGIELLPNGGGIRLVGLCGNRVFSKREVLRIQLHTGLLLINSK